MVGRKKNEKREERKISNDMMMAIQNKLGCSDLDVLKLGQCLRVFLGQGKLETGLKTALTSRNRAFNELFSVKKGFFSKNDGSKEQEARTVVIADLPSLITVLLDKREIDPNNHQLHLGLDGGQCVLKICLLVCPAVGSEDEPPRKRAFDPVGSSAFKFSSANKLMIIAAVHGVDENYDNVKQLLELLDMDSAGESPFSVDIKMMYLLSGKQSAGCRHNCPYCECFGDFKCPCQLYTLGSLKEHLTNFENAGKNKKNAKNYSNVINPALITGPDSLLLLEILSFPSLHVLTGVTGKLINELIKGFRVEERGNDFVTQFMKSNGIKWCEYRPQTFEGNQARKMVKFSHKLEVEARKIPDKLSALKSIQFARTLRLFNDVVIACFGQDLVGDYVSMIGKFEEQYRMLGISITPKAHLVFTHLEQFLKLKGETTGLGKWTEQAMEAAHSQFRKEWELKKLDVNHPSFGENFIQTIVRFNSKRV